MTELLVRVSVVYSENAGGGVKPDALQRVLEAEGYRIVAMHRPEETSRWSTVSCDLVVAAGGDGTVQRVVATLARKDLPLAIVPSGTANNVATSLGIRGSLREVVASWETARKLPLDVGVVRGPWGERCFVESTGCGLVAEGIRAMDDEAPHAEEADPDAMLAKARDRYRTILATLEPVRCTLVLDGLRTEADLLLLEVLNTRCIGPRLVLAPQADPDDACFDVVTVTVAERAALDRLLQSAAQPGDRPELPTRRAARVSIRGPELLHVDDRVHAYVGGEPLELRVLPRALEILVPAASAPVEIDVARRPCG